MTRNKTSTIVVICALLTLMALGGLSRYRDGMAADSGDWITAGENTAKKPGLPD